MITQDNKTANNSAELLADKLITTETPCYDDNVVITGRIALGIEYTGTAYKGWQRQSNVDSVQAHIEAALGKMLLNKTPVICAGRTDAGVHATAQTVHFDTELKRPIKAYTRGLNTLLPKDIAVTWAVAVNNKFHARFSAYARRYRYVIYNHRLRSGVFGNGVTHIYKLLDENLMHEAAQCLVGEQDFTSFRASLCQSKTPHRKMYSISVHRIQNYVVVDVRANAFLHHMVRNIVGSLVKVGAGEAPVEWMAQVLKAKDRTQAAATALPNGLYLVDVDYPEEYAIPKTDLGPLFLPN